MSDTGSTSLSPTEGSSGYNESDDLDDDIEFKRAPIQLFDCKCEDWDDVVTVLQKKSQPGVLEKFLLLYRMQS